MWRLNQLSFSRANWTEAIKASKKQVADSDPQTDQIKKALDHTENMYNDLPLLADLKSTLNVYLNVSSKFLKSKIINYIS